MSRRTAARIAWTLVAASAACGFAGTGLKLAFGHVEGWHFVTNDLAGIARPPAASATAGSR